MVLVLADTLDLRSEAFRYALELASRTDSSLFLFVVLPLEGGGNRPAADKWARDMERTAAERLGSHAEAARTAGVEMEALLKRGVPSSEVIKFLASSGTVHTIVWGGEESLASEKVRSRRAHWLTQIRDKLPCPVVIPLPKSGADKPL